MRTYQAVLFDLDGTLLDTLRDICETANAVLAERGLPTHGGADYRRMVGYGVRSLWTQALPEGSTEAEIDEATRAFRQLYAHTWNVHSRPYDGVPELLDTLTARGVPMAVLSNKPHDATVRCVDELLSPWPFEPVFGQRAGIPVKPDPRAALEIAAHLGLEPRACLFLGDSDIDVHTALAAGMHPAGALWGFRDEVELREAGAHSLLERPQDLLELLG